MNRVFQIIVSNKFQNILRCSPVNFNAFKGIHISRSEYQSLITCNFYKVSVQSFSALLHGDYEWQDPKSDDEM